MVLCKVDKSNVSNINIVSKRLKSAICCVFAYQHVDKFVGKLWIIHMFKEDLNEYQNNLRGKIKRKVLEDRKSVV